MANAIPMIKRCARYGTAEGWQEYGPVSESLPPTPSFPEEEMGNGQQLSDVFVVTP